MTPDSMDVTFADGSISIGGTEVCSDCGTSRPPSEMDYYSPNPLGIEWVCKLGVGCRTEQPDDEPAPRRRYTWFQAVPYYRITRQ